jgi:hypothetical protein
MLELSIARAEGEIAWCERIADLIAQGASYQPVEKSPDAAWPGWQADLDARGQEP